MEELMNIPWTPYDTSVTPHLQKDFVVQALKDHCSIANVTKFEISPFDTKGDGFASNLFQAVVECTNENAEKETYNLILKLVPASPAFRYMRSSNDQFMNECIFFNEVVPAFHSLHKSKGLKKVSSPFPKCYLASGEPDHGVLIMNNLVASGYKMGNRYGLDYDHTKLAMEAIAHYHATSIAMKQLENEKFRKILDKFVEAMFVPEKMSTMAPDPNLLPNKIGTLVEAEAKVDGAQLAAKIRNRLCDNPDHMINMIVPEEPLAVLCHGDFCRNNVMFKYDDDNKPISIKFFDFQSPRYASPAIDLSFWFCVCTTPELREAHWEDLMDVYVKCLRTRISDLGADPSHFTKEAILDDYAKHAMYGFYIACFFLSSMLSDPEDSANVDEISNMDPNDESAKTSWMFRSPLLAPRMVALTREYTKRGFL